MKLLSILTFALLLVGCSGEQISHNITKTQIAMSGNKPPAFFSVANIETMRDYIFNAKDFSFKFPTAKQSDFNKMGGWKGGSSRNGKTITLYLKSMYHMDVSTSGNVLDYGERARAVENKDQSYITYVRKKYQYPKNTKLYYGMYGKENYNCMIKERKDKFNRYKASYDCYKYNPTRTNANSVTVSLTYSQSSSKQYTYQDLKQRAKRTLDSLYIKDGW